MKDTCPKKGMDSRLALERVMAEQMVSPPRAEKWKAAPQCRRTVDVERIWTRASTLEEVQWRTIVVLFGMRWKEGLLEHLDR